MRKAKKGQINIGSVFGDMLVQYCALPEVHNVVEIGTWNGRGSTACIVKGLTEIQKEKNFISFEACLKQHKLASPIYSQDWIKILHGRILEISEITFDFSILVEPQKTWAKEDLENYKTCPNLISVIPSKIDLLLLDGGEFTTFDEFILLKDRTHLFFLDDITTFKNKKVAELIEKDSAFTVLYKDSGERNGIMIARKTIV